MQSSRHEVVHYVISVGHLSENIFDSLGFLLDRHVGEPKMGSLFFTIARLLSAGIAAKRSAMVAADRINPGRRTLGPIGATQCHTLVCFQGMQAASDQWQPHHSCGRGGEHTHSSANVCYCSYWLTRPLAKAWRGASSTATDTTRSQHGAAFWAQARYILIPPRPVQTLRGQNQKLDFKLVL
jgi:hypothetical protein